jgi:hypothetical protein
MTHLAYLLSGDVWGLSLGTRLPVAICQLSTDASFISTSLGWLKIPRKPSLSQPSTGYSSQSFPRKHPKTIANRFSDHSNPTRHGEAPLSVSLLGSKLHNAEGGWRRVQERYHEILNGLVCKSTGKHVFKAGGFSSKIWRNSSSNLGVYKPTGADFPNQFSTSEVSSHQQNESKWHCLCLPTHRHLGEFLDDNGLVNPDWLEWLLPGNLLLVGGWPTPLKNHGVRQLGWWFPIYGKIKNVPNHQPVMVFSDPKPMVFLADVPNLSLGEVPITSPVAFP